MKRQICLLLVIGLLSGCGGPAGGANPSNPEDTSTTQPSSATTTTVLVTTSEPAGSGHATITVDGKTIDFSSFTCLVGHDETATLGAEYEEQSFAGYTGMVDGSQLTIWIYDTQMQGRLSPPAEGPSLQSGWWVEVQADSIGDDPWSWGATNAGGADDVLIEFDGSHLRGSGTFYSWIEDEEGRAAPGTFEAQCA